MLALGTGLRQGEILALRWSDINFEENELKVQRTFKRVQLINRDNSKNKTELIVQEPKTKNSKRTIPIPSAIATELKRHKIRQAEEKLKAGDIYVDNDLIFPNAIGEPTDAKNITRSYKRGLKRDDISTTANVYTHVLLRQKIKAVDRLNDLFAL
ncbi:phage integrase family protein [Clostridium ragsdalei P11]|uniref:Phage integrase family protein n=2 Tax=Clostridium ragsdalei TaxID=217158 RepID=A0A1A6AJ36_9CLOT|nr:phage integrase family protein [Clostridium ragsdalei P11]